MRIGVENQSGAVATADTARPKRLARAAQEFETQMMKELLKPMTGQDGLTGEQADGGEAGILGEFSAEALAGAISRQGGFGIAERIVKELSRYEAAPTAGMRPAIRDRNLR